MLPASRSERFGNDKKKKEICIFNSKEFVFIDTSEIYLNDVEVPKDHPTYKIVKLSNKLDFAQITFRDGHKYAGGIVVENVKSSDTPKGEKKFFASFGESSVTDLIGNSDSENVFQFNIDKQIIQLHGVGELHFRNGDRYSGSFQRGKRHGYGIMIYQKERIQYYGEWENDSKEGYGVGIYKDGSVYEGRWSHDKKNGQGTFSLSNGYAIRGNWNNDDIANAQFIPLNANEDISKCSTILLRQMTEQFKDVKFCYFSPNAQETYYPNKMLCGRKWQGFFAKKEKSIAEEANAFRNSFDDIPTKITIRTFIKRREGFLSICVSEFIKIFHFRYNVITTQTAEQLKPHAMDDLLTFVNEIYLNISEKILGEYKNVADDLFYIIKDFILDKSYELLMTIYKLAYKEQDDDLDLRLESLQNTTMKDIGIGKDYIPNNGMEGYTGPILHLRELENEKIPSKKFDLLKKVKQETLDAMKDVREKVNGITKYKEQGADDSVPVYIYVFLKAAIPYAYSEMKFMIDLQDNRQRHSEAENAYTSLMEIPIEFLLKTDWNIRDENGFLTQSSMLESQLERKYRDICQQLKKGGKNEKEFGDFMKGVYIQLSNSLSITKGSSIPFDDDSSKNFTQFKQFVEQILDSSGLKLKKTNDKFEIEIIKPFPSYVYFNLAKVFLKR